MKTLRIKMKLQHVLLIAALMILCACGGSKTQTSGKGTEYTGKPIDTVLVVGVSDNIEDRRLFETTFAQCLADQGITAQASLALMPADRTLSKQEVKRIARESKAQAVLVSRLVGVDTEVDHYRSGIRRRGSVAIHRSMDNYNPTVKRDARSGYYIERKVVRLESNLFDVRSEGLIRTIRSETLATGSLHQLAHSVCRAMVDDFRRHNLIR